MRKIVNYFLQGLLIFVPIAITLFFIVWVFTSLDSLLGKFVEVPFPGVGLLLTIAVITVIGFIASNFIGKRLFGLVDAVFKRLPLVKLLYNSVRDLIEAFAGDKKRFNKPVLVELVAGGPRAMGFITRETLEFIHLAGYAAVYFPQSYNFAGQVLIFPKERIAPVDIDSSEAMTFIVSGGVAGKHKADS